MEPCDLTRFVVDVLDDACPRVSLLSRLYYEATAQGKYLAQLFPHMTAAEIDALRPSHRGASAPTTAPFYLSGARGRGPYTHLAHKACSRPLKAGEPVRRCQQCGFDSSCVLCVKCFNPDDHVGHNITTYISTGLNNGVCDCGDPEAFKPLHCLCITPESDVSPPPLDMAAALDRVLDVCLNVLLDVLEFSVHTVHDINEVMNTQEGKLSDRYPSDRHAREARFSARAYGKEESDAPDKWHLVLWNDEFHNYQTACESIICAIHVSARRAQEIAEEINSVGYAILATADSHHELIEACSNALGNELTATIISDRDWRRRDLAEAILWWLKDITLIDSYPQFAQLASTMLARKFLAPDHMLNKARGTDFFYEDMAGRGVLNNGTIFHEARVNMVDPSAALATLQRPLRDGMAVDKTTRFLHSPLQLFLIYHCRLSKKARHVLSALLLSILLPDPDTKVAFSKHFMQIYPNLLTIYARVDREEGLSILREITPQLFTCPRTIRSIIDRGELPLLLAPLADIIEHTECYWSRGTTLLYKQCMRDELFYSDYRSARLAIERGIADLCSVFSQARLYLELDQSWFMHLLLLLRPYQGFWEIERKRGDHVDYDDNDFVVHITDAAFVGELAAIVGQLPGKDKRRLMATPINYILSTAGPPKTVSKDRISFVNPIHTLLSCMIQTEGWPDLLPPQLHKVIMGPLNSIVLANQVKARLWIRNGSSVKNAALMYFGPHMNQVTYFCDIYLCQAALALDEPGSLLTQFLSQWELLRWFRGEQDVDHTAYEEHFSRMVESFLVFLYIVVTDRAMLTMNEDQHRKLAARMTVIYALCEGPQPYSRLIGAAERIDMDIDLDAILDDIADFQPPSALDDRGMYRLKPCVFDTFDPITRYLDYSNVQSVLDAKTQRIAKASFISEKEVVIEPYIPPTTATHISDKLCGVAKLPQFAKLAFKLLRHAIDSLDHTYVYVLLHLIHAVIAEDAHINGPLYLNPPFVQVPIGSLLLTIAQLEFPAAIVKKASFLLDRFLEKSSTVGEELVMAFGEDTVRRYTERNKSNPVSVEDQKKAASERRRLKVLKKFAKQRDAFLLKNESCEELQEPTTTTTNPYLRLENLRVCVVCGEKESIDSLFGLFARKSPTPTLWPAGEQFDAVSFSSFEQQMISSAPPFTPSEGVSRSLECGQPTLYSTCGHGVHFKCYKRGWFSKSHPECPLCRSSQDTIVPTFMFSRMPILASDESILSAADKNVEWSVLVGTHSFNKPSGLFGMLLLPQYDGTLKRKWAEVIKTFVGGGHVDDYNYVSAMLLCGDIANTVRMLEVGTRIEGDIAYYDFLSLVPGSAYSLTRSLLQTRAIVSNPDFNSWNPDYIDLVHKQRWGENAPKHSPSPFAVLVNLFLQTEESLNALTFRCFHMVFAQLIDQMKVAVDSATKFSLSEDNINPDALQAIQTIGQHLELPQMNNSQLTTVYLMWERLALIYLRQAVLFQDILTSTCVGENEYERSLQFKNLSYQIQRQPYLASSETLTMCLGLRSFDEHLISIAYKIGKTGKIIAPIYNFRLENPGAPRLINLPEDHFACATYITKQSLCDNGNLVICLNCGKVLSRNIECPFHAKKCLGTSNIFYNPRRNEFTFIVYMGGPFPLALPGPYLTKHGEVRKWNSSEKATLSRFRYEAINKLWVTQGLYDVASRHLHTHGDRAPPMREMMEGPMMGNPMLDVLLQNGIVVQQLSDTSDVDMVMFEDDNVESYWLDSS